MRVLDQPADRDLEPFSQYLWLNRLRHRIYQDGNRQVLEVINPGDAAAVREAFAAWDAGTLELPQLSWAPASGQGGLRRLALAGRQYPVLLVTLLLAVLVFVLTAGGQADTAFLRSLFFFDPARPPTDWWGPLVSTEFWRQITPALVHLSILHIVFNCLIVWELGRRIEPALGQARFLLLLLVLALGSNWAQFLSAEGLFGGLSGVGYGLLGFIVIAHRRQPQRRRWWLPPGFAISLLVMLVAFSVGAGLLLGLQVANGAHWGGFVLGLLAALLLPPSNDGLSADG